MNPTVNGWKANCDDNTYSVEWSNPKFGNYFIYCQPFYDCESDMEIFIFESSIDDMPHRVAKIELEYMRFAYQKGDLSIEQLVTEFLNLLRKYIDFIEFKISNRIKYHAY